MNKCQKCRKFNQKLFLKGERCDLPKCAFTRNVASSTGPMAGKTKKTYRRKKSEYGLQLSEKQKAKAQYGIRERQLANIFKKANQAPTATGETMLVLLERRLDNVIYRLGWAPSRSQARQMINHGKIKINNKKVDIPSYSVKIKDIIEPKDLDSVKKQMQEKITPPTWLKYDKKTIRAEIINLPVRDDIDITIDEQLIVEFYSR